MIGHGQFYYSRDHAAGPGAWCVRGPNGFMMPVPDKTLAAAIGEMMSGNWDDAKTLMDSVALWDAAVVSFDPQWRPDQFS